MGDIFDSTTLSPHGFCLLWRPGLLALHATSDLLIGLSYSSIPLALGWIVWRRPDITFGWIFWLFAAFILACGASHFFSIWNLWHADYGPEGVVKAVTAGVSVVTAVTLWPLAAKAAAAPSHETLRRVNDELAGKIVERDEALGALRRESADREQAENKLRQSQKLELIGQLTGGVAHDFNNLLTVITGNLELLQLQLDRRHEPALAGLADRALQGAQRGAALTRQLLAFARRQSLDPLLVDPAELVRSSAGLWRRLLTEAVAFEVEAGDPSWSVFADRNQLEGALLNLIVNARDAIGPAGRIVVRVENVAAAADRPLSTELLHSGDYVAISVIDDGSGMTEAVRSQAIEPFFTTKDVGRGSGLGLSQVYGFVKQSNGSFDLESAPGAGTRVTLYLPRASFPLASTEDRGRWPTEAAAATP